MLNRIERVAIVLLGVLIAVSGFGGAVGLVGGGLQFPLAWLEGTPFASYTLPGLILGVVVGGSALIAALLVLGRHPLGVLAAVGAGLIQVGWIVGEVILVGTSPGVMLVLQVLYFALGAGLGALAADLWLRTARRGVSGAHRPGRSPTGPGPSEPRSRPATARPCRQRLGAIVGVHGK